MIMSHYRYRFGPNFAQTLRNVKSTLLIVTDLYRMLAIFALQALQTLPIVI